VSRVGFTVDGPAGAPWLVLGPSMGTTTAMWEPQVAVFARWFRVLRFDLRGHGGSAVPPGPYRIDDLGQDLRALLDEQGIERCSYAGVSLGGMVGMWLASAVPDRVDRLALLCTSAYLPPARGWTDRAAQARASGTGSLTDTVPLRWFTPGFPERKPDVYAGYQAMLAGIPDEGYAGCCEAIAAMDLRPDLGRITARTLVISGEDDLATPPPHGEAIAAAVAGAKFVTMAQTAHLANVEQPGLVLHLLAHHFRGADD
jgi:3-oxoadipate enol-lactonase